MTRETVVAHLHPTMQSRHGEMAVLVHRRQLPFEPYEMWRSPRRQVELYARGRVPSVPGGHATYERAWQSAHQYGLAVDWVGWVDGRWSWSDSLPWKELHECARVARLEPLEAVEMPHVQMPGASGRKILAGAWPEYGAAWGDSPWEQWMEAAILDWGQAPVTDRYGLVHPAAPRPPQERPALVVPPGMTYDEETGLCVPSAPAQ